MVLVATALLCLGAGTYAALHFKISVDEAAMFPDDLPHRVITREFHAQFPMLQDTLLIVVEGPTPTLTQIATLQLSQRLRTHHSAAFRTIFAPGADPFMNRAAFLYQSVEEVEEIADHLARVQPYIGELNRDPSLRGVLNVLGWTVREGGDAVFEQKEFNALLASLGEVVDGTVADSPKVLPWDEMLSGKTATKADRRQFIVVQPVLNPELMRPATAAIEAVAHETTALGFSEENGYRVRLTGEIALLHDDVNAILSAGVQSTLLSFALVAIMVWFALRSGRLILAILATLTVGLILTTAFAFFAVGELDIISMAFGALIIGLSVDFGIHFGMAYWEEIDAGRQHSGALAATGERLGIALLLCAATTAIGFLSFQVTDYLSVAHLGLICGGGMFICLFCTVTIMPAVLTLWPARLPRRTPTESPLRHRILSFPSRHAKPVLWAFATLGGVALLCIPKIYFDYNPIPLRDQRAESVHVFFELLGEEGGVLWSVSRVEQDYETARKKVAELRQLDVVKSAFTVHDFIPDDQEEKLAILEDVALFLPPPPSEAERLAAPTIDEDAEAVRRLLQDLALAIGEHPDDPRYENVRQLYASLSRLQARLEKPAERAMLIDSLRQSIAKPVPLFLDRLYTAIDPGEITLADIPKELYERMVTPDGKFRIEVYPKENLRDNAAILRFHDQIQTALPGAVGMVPEFLESGNTIVRSFREALLTAIVVMVFVVFLIWRRVLDTLYVMLPLLLGALLTCATMVLTGMSFNYANVIMLPLMLGIGIDTGIHLVQRYRNEGMRGAELLGSSTSRAVLWSALTTIASFGSLATSHHMGMATLGRLLSIGILWMLVCNLIFLPALLERLAASERKP